MPLYEFKCSKCGNEKEIITSFQYGSESKLCDCGGEMVKQVGKGSFKLKGSGWAKDNYN